MSDPAAFLSLHADKLVILDEIQRAPDLFMVLRGLIDTNRQAGRISNLQMAGLNLLEVPTQTPADIQKLWLRGGFPKSYLAPTDELGMTWLENLVRTYLERDIPQLGFRVPTAKPVLGDPKGATGSFSYNILNTHP